MAIQKRAWLLAVGKGEEKSSLTDRWIEARPELLETWPVAGTNVPNEIEKGDHIIYFAAGHGKIIAAGRAKGRVVRHDLDVAIYLACPRVQLGPDLSELGKPTSEIRGKRAYELTDAQYKAGLDAFVSTVWDRYED